MVYRKRIAKTKQKEFKMIKFDEYCKVLFVPSFDNQIFRITLCKNANKTYSVDVDMNIYGSWISADEMEYTTNVKSVALECIKHYQKLMLDDMNSIIEKMQPKIDTINRMAKILEQDDDGSPEDAPN
jgi:hypothetical protein